MSNCQPHNTSEVDLPAGSPVSTEGLPRAGPAGFRYLFVVEFHSPIAQEKIIHEQDWYDREFGLEWAGDFHQSRELEESVHRVMDHVRPDFAFRALDPVTVSGGIRVK